MKLVDERMPTVEVKLTDDKTLWVKVGNVGQIGRVIVEDGSMFCKVFYADSAKGEWIDMSEDGYVECPLGCKIAERFGGKE